MFNTTGFDFDLLISRLYGGIRAYQSLRAHRRQRAQGEAPPPEPTQAPEAAAAPPQPQPAHAPDIASETPPPTLHQQGFITIGGRVLPLFGNEGAFTFDASPPASTNPPPAMSPVPPPQVAPPASALILPPPTPPASFRHLFAAAQAPAPAGEPVEAARPAGALPTIQVEQAPNGPSIDALLAAHARDEAARLEQLQAEHRAHVALLLREHRAELDARAQAEAARTTQLLRELLAEHRAELTRATSAHAAEMASVLAQHREVLAERRAAGLEHDQHGDALRQALTEQATLQREAHEEVAHHIDMLTTVVADIGQAVTMLAMTTFEGQQGRLPTAGADAPSPTPLAAPSPAERTAIVEPTPEPAAALLPGASASACVTAPEPQPPIASDEGASVILDLRKPTAPRAVAQAQDRALALDDD